MNSPRSGKARPNKYCLDTVILVWGIQQPDDEALKEKVQRTRRYLSHLEHQGSRIIIPTPALAEFLSGLDEAKAEAALRHCARRFEIHPFDLSKARIAARLVRDSNRVPTGQPGHRQEFKVDIQIAAIAMDTKCDQLLTADNDFNNIAIEGVEVKVGTPPHVMGPQEPFAGFDS